VEGGKDREMKGKAAAAREGYEGKGL